MSVNNSNKRKGKANPSTGALNTASKPKPRSPKEKADSEAPDTTGIYDNPTFMHSSATVVGCLCHLQVVSGFVYEGIFLTFSDQLEVVLSAVLCLGSHPLPPAITSPTSCISSLLQPEVEVDMAEIMVFDFKDIVKLHFVDVDPDYAIKDFTDTGISKFNGQVQERELEPWEGGTAGDGDSLLGVETGGPVSDGPSTPCDTRLMVGQQNGWDVNEMFRTNAEKYGVTSTYDDNLIGYTVQLEKKNTPEYQRREIEAMKVANEINSSAASKSRLQLENGDDDKSSAVVRPTPPDNRYMTQQKKKPLHGGQKPMRNQASSRQPGHYRPHTPSPPVRLPSRQTDSPVSPPALDGEEQHKSQQRPPEPPRAQSPPPPTSAFPPRRRDSADKKSPQQKSREEIEDLKKFQAKFKNVYQEEATPAAQPQPPRPPTPNNTKEELAEDAESPPTTLPSPASTEEEALPPAETPPPTGDTAKSPSKPFVWNLNAKSFTPRNQPPAAATTPPAPAMVPSAGGRGGMPPQQLAPAPQGNSPLPLISQHFIPYVPQLAQTSYMLPTAAATRMKKMERAQWQEMRTLPQRHELTPVAAATGPPILTPSPSAASQSLMQYHHHHAASAGGHPQLYPQMYQVMAPPRLMHPPPPVPMVPSNTAAAYGGDLHAAAATSIFVTHPGNSAAGLGSSNGPPTPQTAPSPVHQPPSSHAQPLMYPTAGYGPGAGTPAGHHMVLMSHHHHGPTPAGVHPGLHGQATPPIHTTPYTTAAHHQEASHGIQMRNWYPTLYLVSNDGRRPNQGDSQPPCYGGQQDHN